MSYSCQVDTKHPSITVAILEIAKANGWSGLPDYNVDLFPVLIFSDSKIGRNISLSDDHETKSIEWAIDMVSKRPRVEKKELTNFMINGCVPFVYADKVKVGCTTVKESTIRAILDTMKEIQSQ